MRLRGLVIAVSGGEAGAGEAEGTDGGGGWKRVEAGGRPSSARQGEGSRGSEGEKDARVRAR